MRIERMRIERMRIERNDHRIIIIGIYYNIIGFLIFRKKFRKKVR
jgi:hypothetical protein